MLIRAVLQHPIIMYCNKPQFYFDSSTSATCTGLKEPGKTLNMFTYGCQYGIYVQSHDTVGMLNCVMTYMYIDNTWLYSSAPDIQWGLCPSSIGWICQDQTKAINSAFQ